MGFYVQRDVENEEIKFKTDLYYFSFGCHVLCMTSGIPAIESKGYPYSFMTSMEDGSEHISSFHDYLPGFSKPPKTNDDPGVYKENKNASFTFAIARGASSSIDHITHSRGNFP